MQKYICDLKTVSLWRVQETFDKTEMATPSHLHKLWKWWIHFGICLRTSPHPPKRKEAFLLLSPSLMFSQWDKLLEMLEFVSKNLPKIRVSILGKNPSLDIFSLRRLCLFSALKSKYMTLWLAQERKKKWSFKPRGANYAFSNIMQFLPHYVFIEKITYLSAWVFYYYYYYYLFYF